MGGSNRASTLRKKLPASGVGRRGGGRLRRGLAGARPVQVSAPLRWNSSAFRLRAAPHVRTLRSAHSRQGRTPAERRVVRAVGVGCRVLAQRQLPEAAADLITALPDLNRYYFAWHGAASAAAAWGRRATQAARGAARPGVLCCAAGARAPRMALERCKNCDTRF